MLTSLSGLMLEQNFSGQFLTPKRDRDTWRAWEYNEQIGLLRLRQSPRLNSYPNYPELFSRDCTSPSPTRESGIKETLAHL